MNKVIIIVIGVVVIAGAIFAFKNFYNQPITIEPTPTTTSQTPPPQQLPTSQGTTPPAQVSPTTTPTPTPTPKPVITKPPTTSSNVLDRIEAAIRAKLKR